MSTTNEHLQIFLFHRTALIESVLPLVGCRHPLAVLHQGLAGSVMIASGLMVWAIKRKSRLHTSGARRGHGVVCTLNLAVLAGLPLASAAYFWANRLLPSELARRADWNELKIMVHKT